MEQDRYYLRVGMFISGIMLAAVLIIGVFATGGHKEDYETYAIYFTGSVDGLGVGSQVRLKGINVGNVKAISFAPHAKDLILVLVNILKGAPVRNDTVATVQPLGITGSSCISLNYNGTDPTPKTKKDGEEYPVIASTPSSLEEVFNSIPQLVSEVKTLSGSVQALLSDENVTAVHDTLVSINASAKTLQNLLGSGDPKSVSGALLQFNETLIEAKLAMREVRMLARTVRDDPSVIIHGVKHDGKQLPND